MTQSDFPIQNFLHTCLQCYLYRYHPPNPKIESSELRGYVQSVRLQHVSYLYMQVLKILSLFLSLDIETETEKVSVSVSILRLRKVKSRSRQRD